MASIYLLGFGVRWHKIKALKTGVSLLLVTGARYALSKLKTGVFLIEVLVCYECIRIYMRIKIRSS